MIDLFKLTTFLTATGISFLVGFFAGGLTFVRAKVSRYLKDEDDEIRSIR